METVQVDNASMLLQAALTPCFKLLAQCLVEATDRAGAGSHTQQRLGDFSDFVCARPRYEHLRHAFGDRRFISTVAFKRRPVELTVTVSEHFDILDPTRGCD